MAALLLLAGCGGGGAAAEPAFRGAVLDDPYVVPPTSLVDTSGQDFSLVSDTDKPRDARLLRLHQLP